MAMNTLKYLLFYYLTLPHANRRIAVVNPWNQREVGVVTLDALVMNRKCSVSLFYSV